MNEDYENENTEQTEEKEPEEEVKTVAPEPKKKKKRRLKTWVMNLLFAIIGGVIGETVAAITSSVSFLKWLSYKVNLGIVEPLDINIIIAHFKFAFYFVFNPALVLFIILALVIGNLVISNRK